MSYLSLILIKVSSFEIISSKFLSYSIFSLLILIFFLASKTTTLPIRISFFEIFRSFRGKSSKKFDFGHRSGVLDRPGGRELRAVEIPASYDAWRPPKRRKNDLGKKLFFWVSGICFSSCFLDFKGNRLF